MARSSFDRDSGSNRVKPIKTKTAAQIAAERAATDNKAREQREREEKRRQREYDRRNK